MEFWGRLLSGKESPPFCCIVIDQKYISCQPSKELTFSEFNSWFLGELWKKENLDQALSLWSGSTDSKTLDYQRTNPREEQTVRTHTKETTGIQDLVSPNHPVQHNSSKQQTKQKYEPNHQQTGLPPHSMSLNIRGKTQTNKTQHKSHPIQSLHKPLD